MTISEQIKVLCVRCNVSVSELARRVGTTPQNFNAKLKRNTITQDELNQIAKALDVTYWIRTSVFRVANELPLFECNIYSESTKNFQTLTLN